MKLRSGPSGPVFVGNANGDLLRWNEESQGWDAGPSGISSVFIVDRGTPGSNPNGSYVAPFPSVQAALDAAKASTAGVVAVLVAPGFYQAQGPLEFKSDPGRVLMIGALTGGLAGNAPAIGPIEFEGSELVLQGIAYGGLSVTGKATLRGCKTLADFPFTSQVTGTLTGQDSEWQSGSMIDAEFIELQGCQLTSTTLNPDEDARVLLSRFSGSAECNIGNGPGNLGLDSLSLYYWQLVGGVINNGSVAALTPD